MNFHNLRAFTALAIAGLLLAVAPAQAQKWGTIKGQVVWGEKGGLPKNPEANVDKDKAACLADGPILKNELVVDPKTKGVKNVAIWLVSAEDRVGQPEKAIPVNPKVKAALPKDVVIDQPCCVFEPRIVPVVKGQKLVVKNSANIAHNTKIDGGAMGPNINPLMPPKSKIEVGEVAPRLFGVKFSCSIHSWMTGYLVAVPNPYVVVTKTDGTFTLKDVPAGKYMLMAWHEKGGWILMNPKVPARKGKIIDIKPDGTTDLAKISFKLPTDDE